ncbi:MAG: HNH endonuclease signature motif containing protein [Hyphomicrobiales bacterium]|nr:HNH endonuclease signature motif containing protein [Hyphomicrobiales bacterium]
MIAELCASDLSLSEVPSDRRRGPKPRTLAEVAARIISRSVPDGECLIWTGALARGGYGMVTARGLRDKPIYVHRVVFAAHHGEDPTWGSGLELSHLCGVPACVNVAHLVVEPHAANMGRIPEDRRGRHTAFDTEAVAAEIAREDIWQVVVRHGLSYGHAARIRNGWRPKKAYRPAPTTSESQTFCPAEAPA